MKIITHHNNEISLSIDSGETVYFKGRFLRGRSFGVPLFPPFPLGSPIARVWYGCYLMDCASSNDGQHQLQLIGDSGLGKFEVITLSSDDRYFIHPRDIVAFAFQGSGGIKTQLRRLFSPSCWGIHHPLPVVAHGPGYVVVYAENLFVSRTTSYESEFIPNQIVAFDCRQPFTVKTLRPNYSPVSHAVNALIEDNRICFMPDTKIFVTPINKPVHHKLRQFIHVLLHIAVFYLAFLLLRGS
jgi:hypothetical protein